MPLAAKKQVPRGSKRFTNETTNPTTGSTSIPEVTFNLRYPRQYYDKESNLHYNYFRSYSAERGRYTQADPIGLDGGFNRFGYVDGNPLSFVDLEGLAGTIPKNYGKGKPLPPTDQLPKDAKQQHETNQQKHENDSWKCLFLPCEATKEIKKATICLLSICTACDGTTFLSGPKAPQSSIFQSNTTSCKCIEYGLDPNYRGGPPPGLTAPGR